MKVINADKLRPYLIEIIRLFIILFVIYVFNNFASSLPFVSSVTIFNDNILLTEVLSFIMTLIACFIIYEFGKRSFVYVEEMVVILPQAGVIHSYLVYLAVIITAYFSGLGLFVKTLGSDWLWSYNILFIAFSLFYISKIILIFYKNSHKISSDIFDAVAGDIIKK
ncbi:MAG: hypothetical protein ACP5SD_01210 [Elusimicrobiales bacterium]|jgi:hypothetical protein|nr:hypothetical protein [Elusimicrobiales bacterium]HOL63064.1 hypothetical protein [Elusimicrobiales bacterium]HPO95381.1 hypothetical protein [Elusimicrobiales bacterium]